MPKKKAILIAPLNWGLGHATRCVPIINNFVNKGHKVIIAADGGALLFLQLEFPNLKFIPLKGFKIRYAKKPFFLLFLLLQMPFFYLSIKREHKQLKKIIKKYNVNQVVSDNRYGLYNVAIKSILITHQIFIPLPKTLRFLNSTLYKLTRKWIEKFNECWIPDYEMTEESLSGKLAHGSNLPINVKYIGPLSRFKNIKDEHVKLKLQCQILIIISGPEPHRTNFEKEMEMRFSKSDKRIVMVCGKLSSKDNFIENTNSNITKVNHISTAELLAYMYAAEKIIARSGYSTIMDLHVIKKKAELNPTPGQLEQEYLAEYYKKSCLVNPRQPFVF